MLRVIPIFIDPPLHPIPSNITFVTLLAAIPRFSQIDANPALRPTEVSAIDVTASFTIPAPDFNPIEEAFAKLKALLRRAGARTRESLIETMGSALWAITALDADGFFAYCGYREAVPPL
jgi:hypothetical protein